MCENPTDPHPKWYDESGAYARDAAGPPIQDRTLEIARRAVAVALLPEEESGVLVLSLGLALYLADDVSANEWAAAVLQAETEADVPPGSAEIRAAIDVGEGVFIPLGARLGDGPFDETQGGGEAAA